MGGLLGALTACRVWCAVPSHYFICPASQLRRAPKEKPRRRVALLREPGVSGRFGGKGSLIQSQLSVVAVDVSQPEQNYDGSEPSRNLWGDAEMMHCSSRNHMLNFSNLRTAERWGIACRSSSTCCGRCALKHFLKAVVWTQPMLLVTYSVTKLPVRPARMRGSRSGLEAF